MKIAAIDPIVVKIPFTHYGPPAGFGGRAWDTLDYLLVRVESDDGLVGWGEAFGYNIIPSTAAAIEHVIKPLVLGKDAADIRAPVDQLKRDIHIFGRAGSLQFGVSGLDIALWDLLGKRAGLPVAQLLGGVRTGQVPVYASLMKYRDPELVTAASRRCLGSGFEDIKLHETTVEAVRACREAAPDAEVMLDVNCAWTPGEAASMVRDLEPFDLAWLEEPVWPPEDHAALAALRRMGEVPIAAGENAGNAAGIQQLLSRGAVDIVQPSVTKVGGISEMWQAAVAAEAANVRLAPHSPYFGPGLLATLQIAAAARPDTVVEWFFVDLEAPLYPTLSPSAGRIELPQEAGLGADPDHDVVAEYRVPATWKV